ncbi:uncharacterized protein LOC115684433 [Syzygium oleosum]|uniref:uncharacterized protein LOC115684433 n=1 Tax=Syzygium oleosum TaxID=219896 RepID=UPI0024B8D0AC|nr:uncharacterized protein LOC115684433 [Syzygium oleosum]XP_056174040.1 uncharacterized protein LOC115684433 [Syzygium oleosum]
MAPAVEQLKPEPPAAVHCQHILVMRHGNRGDDGTNDSWWTRVPKPWDTPLADAGRIKALETGKKLLAELGCPIHRVVASPFRRCIETARELIAGLFTADNDDTPNVALGNDGDSADSSTPRIKVSIEYGICEMMNDVAQWYHPTDRNSLGFDLEELEASFPRDVVEVTPDRVFMEVRGFYVATWSVYKLVILMIISSGMATCIK